MDPALAGIAAAALIEAMTTDAWDMAKDRFVRIVDRCKRTDPSAINDELDATAAMIRSSRLSSVAQDRSRLTQVIADLLDENAEAPRDVEVFVADLQRELGRIHRQTTVSQKVEAKRDAYTAGRDQRVSIRPDDDIC